MGPAHLAVDLAAKRVAPKAPLGVLLLASEVTDILCIAFVATGIESFSRYPWPHGLFMSTVWSGIAALLATRVFRSSRPGIVIGLLVFSHWVLDFISHPMSANTAPELLLLFDGSPRVGLGLYGALGDLAPAVEIGLTSLGS